LSDRLCYIRRTDRGIVLRGLRLVGGHTDDSWAVDPQGDTDLIVETIEEAADWLKQRIDAASKSEVSGLILDTDGAACTWVKPEDADPDALDSIISDGPVEHDPDDLEPMVQNMLGERLPRLPKEMDFEPLSEDQTSTGARRAIIAVPDVPGRLLKDKLDSIGIRPQKMTSIWHALSIAWDPGIDSSSSAQRIVSSDAPICAIVAIDPIDCRLIWTWSREGELICSGSSRLRRVHGEHEPRAMIWQSDIARTCADWLGWSSQLGVSPARIIVLGEPIAPSYIDDESEGQPDEQALDAAQLGAALTQRWPDATLDLFGEPDPIGATLQRIIHRERVHSLQNITGLEARPTRAHRSMFRWAGLALTAAACVVFLLGWQFLNKANAIKSETNSLQSDQQTILNDFDPNLTYSRAPLLELRSRKQETQKAQSPIEVPAPKPILDAIENVSYVIGTPGMSINSIKVNSRTITVEVSVEEIAQAERLLESLRTIENDLFVWKATFSHSARNQKITATFIANWLQEGDDL
jgi:hypothetical protein